MLIIENITAKNFLSIGAQTQAVSLGGGQLTLVLGHNADLGGEGSRNGVGKTAAINALSYAIYGEALTNIRKDNLINLTNGKHMMVTVDFRVGNNQYRIERGRRPSVLRFFINGTQKQDDDAQGDSRETQKEIERVVGFPHEIFKHIVALNTYTEPFLSMKPGPQREMIEQLLGITELSQKADVLKELIRSTKESIREEEVRITAVRASNERIESNIRDLQRRKSEWDSTHTDKLHRIRETIRDLEGIDIETEIAAHARNADAQVRKNARARLTAELSRTKITLQRSEKTIATLIADLTESSKGICHTCGQDCSHLPTHEHTLATLKSKINEENEYATDLRVHVSELESQLSEYACDSMLEQTFYTDVEHAFQHMHNLATLNEQLIEKSSEANPYVEQINHLKHTAIETITFDTINELSRKRDHQEFLFKLLTSKDSFIRKKIIDQNIAYLNHRLAYYLEKIGLPHNVKFNNDLSVEITEYGRELDFDNLSRGERNRLILGLSWSFRDIYESLNQPMNFMCIDELIDSGMDTQGVENALSILKKMARENNRSILLISHREELIGRVNNVLTVVKTGGFTEYDTDTQYLT